MPRVPDNAVQVAMASVLATDDPDGLPAEDLVLKVLEAAAPVLAEHAARAVLAHMKSHGPQQRGLRRAWQRHFGIAARVAASAFSTREEQVQAAARAIADGKYMACNLGEDGTP
jgi:hypothetical protein